MRFEILGKVLSIEGVRWDSLDLSGAGFEHMRLFSSSIVNCRFDGTEFMDLRLWDTHFEDCSFVKADLRESALATWPSGRTNMWRRVMFDRADLSGAHASGGWFDECTFRSSRMKGFDFLGSKLENCVFSGVLEDVIFDGRSVDRYPPATPLRSVDFSEATFKRVEFRGSHFVDVSLPKDQDVRVIEHYPLVARKALTLLSGQSSPEAKGLSAVLKNDLRFPGNDDSVGIFNRQDWLSWGGESEADLAETILIEAERALP